MQTMSTMQNKQNTQNMQTMQGAQTAQGSSQQNQANMTADRTKLTDKELNYIKDFLSWELLAMKKCSETANMCQDPQIRSLIQQTGQKHKQHYETLLTHLQ